MKMRLKYELCAPLIKLPILFTLFPYLVHVKYLDPRNIL